MSDRTRLVAAVFVLAALFGTLAWAMLGLPAFGHYQGPYGDVMITDAVQLRHALNVVTAVMFDLRGFDTVGEEFVLFASVAGALVILHDQQQDSSDAKRGLPPDEGAAVRWMARLWAGVLMLVGVYIVSQAQLTLGGGFQGGVVIASAWLVIAIAFGPGELDRVGPTRALELAEGLGATCFVATGVVSIALGHSYLGNWLPLGSMGSLTSTGTIALVNAFAGLEVGAGMTLLITTFARPLQKDRETS